MIKAIKKLWNYITSTKHSVGDFIWQMDADLDTLNAMLINAEKGD